MFFRNFIKGNNFRDLLFASPSKRKTIPADIWRENDVVLTLMRRDYVASTLIQRHFCTKCPLELFKEKQKCS